MRILMVSDVYLPRINGVSTSIATYRDSLRALGHEVELIAPQYPAANAKPGARTGPVAAGDESWIRRIPSRGVWRDPEDRMMRYGAVTTLAPRLRERAFDIVHIQTPFVAHYAGVQLARTLGIPSVESYHTYFEEYLGCYLPLPDSLTRVLARRISCAQGNAVDALVTPSQAMRDRLSEYGVATPISVIPTGLDLLHFRGGDGYRFRAELGIAANRPLLLYVGRVAHEKNIDFLLETMRDIRRTRPDAVLLVTGEGPAETHLHRLAERLGLGDNVVFTGYLDRRTTLLDCYAAADVFVFASHTETQGLVLLEAMAMGLPVVAHSIMGTSEVLREGEGALIARTGDHADFAAKVLRILDDAGLHRQLRESARSYAAQWSNESCALSMIALYQRLAARPPGHPP
jgi:glycosyltransferase involved in cell wall biosynthesis